MSLLSETVHSMLCGCNGHGVWVAGCGRSAPLRQQRRVARALVPAIARRSLAFAVGTMATGAVFRTRWLARIDNSRLGQRSAPAACNGKCQRSSMACVQSAAPGVVWPAVAPHTGMPFEPAFGHGQRRPSQRHPIAHGRTIAGHGRCGAHRRTQHLPVARCHDRLAGRVERHRTLAEQRRDSHGGSGGRPILHGRQ